MLENIVYKHILEYHIEDIENQYKATDTASPPCEEILIEDLTCKECEYEDEDPRNLSKHRKTEHSNPSSILICFKCDFKTNADCDLRAHNLKHEQQDKKSEVSAFRCH
jgi:hypothetical protein